MTRNEAAKLTHDRLVEFGLTDWHVRMTTNLDGRNVFLGMCSYKDKCIILNAHHIDIHPDIEIVNTINHEIAHALCNGHWHDEVWADKARELGCTNTAPCSHLSFSPEVIDAIRSGAQVEVSFETEIIHKPKYQITRLQDKCPTCGKVARSISEKTVVIADETKPDLKFINLECGHLIIKNIPKGTPFSTLRSDDGKKPYPFQVEGMRFIEQALAVNKGAAVFDEMGLGKTIQALGYLKFHSEALPALFIVKSGIKFQWFKEILRWLGTSHVSQIIGSSSDLVIPGLKTYIASYDMFVFKTRRGKNGKQIQQGFSIQKFIDAGIKTIILDECQQIKNPDAARTQEIRKIAKETNVIALSGTPWKNRGSEFFTVLNMLAPQKFYSYQAYLNNWVDFYWDGQYRKEGGIRNPARFKEYIKDIAIRRERQEVMSELPSITRNLHYCELDNLTQSTYDDEVSDFVKWWNTKVIGGEEDSFESHNNLLAKLARMRHITGLAKIPATIDFVEEFIEETDRKIAIFVHHKDVGEIIANQISEKLPNIPVLKLTADKSSEERFHLQEEFNKLDKVILVASTLASGEGLNLQTCADCILHERQWNPANEEQAEGRFIRIGQKATQVNGTYITAAGTVDELLANIIERKRVAYHNAMNRGEMPVWNQKAIVKELADAIVKQHSEKGKFTKMASIQLVRK